MKRVFLGLILGCSLMLSSMALTGCNMFRGMAQDSQESLNAVQQGPRDAYHWDARDF